MILSALGGCLLAAALAAPARPAAPEVVIEKVPETSTGTAAARPTPSAGRLGAQRRSLKLIVRDPSGKTLKLEEFLSFIGRADRAPDSDQRLSGIFVAPPDDPGAASRPLLEQKGELITLSWEKLARVSLSLPWPVAEDGFSTVWADKNGQGFADGDAVFLNEEIAITQHRRFRESLRKRMTDWSPIYKPGGKARAATEQAQKLMAEALAAKDGAARAPAFDAALTAVSSAWQKLLFEHGLQIALGSKDKGSLRFGLVIDESMFKRLSHYDNIISAIERTGANWVRLVFRSNPEDFVYGS
ncbi:MAG: hypothetical protein PHU21_13935, partial [Elusimicrobia bacterium]|nr:hypothetical protein [Elusimicrobiota bacterium]